MVKPLSSRNNRMPVVVVDIYKKKSGLLKVSLLLLFGGKVRIVVLLLDARILR